jgi:hypothetical protein
MATEDKKPKAPTGPKTYKAPHDVYVDGVYVRANTPFTTSSPKGKEWERVGPVEKAAAQAADPLTHDDANLDDVKDPKILTAVALARNIPIGEAKTADDIRSVIKAADQAQT